MVTAIPARIVLPLRIITGGLGPNEIVRLSRLAPTSQARNSSKPCRGAIRLPPKPHPLLST